MSVPRAAKLLSPRRRVLLALLLGVSAVVAAPLLSNRSTAQSTRPILISEPASTRAIAVESITRQREPFSPTTEVRWGDDARTRIMLFAMGVDPNASLDEISVTFEDGSHRLHTLVVEHLGAVPQQEWITSVIVRLTDELADVGDVLAGINFRGVASNRVRVAFGHVGGGPPDDPGSVPTPATLAPPSPSPAAAPAGDLTTSEVERIIAQAVSAASALSRAVTVVNFPFGLIAIARDPACEGAGLHTLAFGAGLGRLFIDTAGVGLKRDATFFGIGLRLGRCLRRFDLCELRRSAPVPALSAGEERGDVLVLRADDRDGRPHVDLAVGDDDLQQDALGVGLDLLRHLVGVELVERLALRDAVALGLQPAHDRAGLHPLAQSRELDLARHR